MIDYKSRDIFSDLELLRWLCKGGYMFTQPGEHLAGQIRAIAEGEGPDLCGVGVPREPHPVAVLETSEGME